jgi:Acyl-CoA dehydrogenase, C-terminal domain
MDARLTAEQAGLRDAAARLAADLGPGSVHDLADDGRVGRLEKAVAATGWRTMRSDGATGVEAALVAEELGRRLVDVPFLGPVLADDLVRGAVLADDLRHGAGGGGPVSTIAVDGVAADARGIGRVLVLDGNRLLAGRTGPVRPGADLTRVSAEVAGPLEPAGELSAAHAGRWRALALVLTTADLLGAARGAHGLACDYAKVRRQYGQAIGSYQAVAHPLAEGLALIEGSVSVLRHAAWAVDALPPDRAVRAAHIAKIYCARAARDICETAVQVHGGIGNTWECLAHVYLRRVLASAELFGVRLEEIDCGLS